MEVWKMAESMEGVTKGWLRAWLPGRMALSSAGRNERNHARRLAKLHAECDDLRGRMGRRSYSA